MTQEEKQLLLNDLFGRLLYGVKVGFNKKGDVFTPIKFDLQTKELFAEDKNNNCICIFRYDIFKPYLRPMSSMTEEERTEREKFIKCIIDEKNHHKHYVVFPHDSVDYHDWLNAHHFDYRGLIEKGLALEAPEGIY